MKNRKLKNTSKNEDRLITNKINARHYFKSVAISVFLFSAVSMAFFSTSMIGSIIAAVILVILILLGAWIENESDNQADLHLIRKFKKNNERVIQYDFIEHKN